MRCLPGVKVEAGVVAGVGVRGPGRQADPVGIASSSTPRAWQPRASSSLRTADLPVPDRPVT
jgi:hypothetical protein